MSLLKNEKKTNEPEIKMDEAEQEIVEAFDEEIKRQDKKERSMIVKISPLNVRSMPSFDGKVTGEYKEGDEVSIVDEKDGWGQVKEGGWILLDYVG